MKLWAKLIITIPLLTVIACCSFDSSDITSDSTDSANSKNSTSADESSSSTTATTSRGTTTTTISLAEYFGEDVTGKTLYLIKTNPTSTAISASNAPYISAATGISLNTPSASSELESSNQSSRATHAVLPMIKASAVTFSRASSRAIGNTISANTPVAQISPVVDETTKEIYIDSDSSLNTYRQATATLRAIGTYCYIWVVDGFYASDDAGTHSYTGSDSSYSYTTTSDEQITSAQVSAFANKFDAIYEKVRAVFGEESDKVNYYSSNGWTTVPMNYLSDTGTMVNIVIYDIGADHTNDDSSGVLGYFYSRDYYPNGTHISALSGMSYGGNYSALNYSNEGKYFYIDAASAAEDAIAAYSTIAHEFQHMISYGVKTMAQNIQTTTAYEEMMSMLCEDLLQSYLGVSNDDSPEGRLPFFEACYRRVGLEYRESDTNYAVLSYATNYAFGAWLVRNFGGVKLVQSMAANSYEGVSAIVNAVNSVNSTEYDIGDLLLLYAQGCALSSAKYTHKKVRGYKNTLYIIPNNKAGCQGFRAIYYQCYKKIAAHTLALWQKYKRRDCFQFVIRNA